MPSLNIFGSSWFQLILWEPLFNFYSVHENPKMDQNIIWSQWAAIFWLKMADAIVNKLLTECGYKALQ